jgi:Amt family ammonium transporter
VHNIAGLAALASILYVGKRRIVDRGPHSIPLVALGTGLLWFGWYGFNAGSEFRVDSVTATAFLNTDVAASFAAVTWLLLAWVLEKKPKFVGLLTGAVAGLATITPAAGSSRQRPPLLIGIIAGIVCYYAVALKNRLRWDDALDVWGVHGVGGFLGIILLGVFATKAFNPAGTDGLPGGEPQPSSSRNASPSCCPRCGRSCSRWRCSGSSTRSRRSRSPARPKRAASTRACTVRLRTWRRYETQLRVARAPAWL